MKGEKLPEGCILTLVIIFLAALIDGLDVSIVNVALPTISNVMGITIGLSSWIIFGYVVGLATFLIPLGKMAKNGRIKKYMLMGTALFGISSFICGISTSFWMLVAFRILQGVAAAMMSCVLPSMVVHMLPKDRKGLGMSVMGASSGVALILGPALGGFIVDCFSWHWLFFINVPICVLIIILAAHHMPKDRDYDREKDPTYTSGISAMLLVGSMLALLQDLGEEEVNMVVKIVCGIIAPVSLIVLIWSIRRDDRRSVIAPKMLINREYIIVGISFLLCTIVVAGATYLLPFLLQHSWDMDPAVCGLYMTATSVAMMVTVLPVGKMCDKIGCKLPSAIAVIARASFCVLMIVLCASLGDPIFLIIPLVCFGISHAFSGTAQPTRMIHHSTPGYEDEATNFMLVINYVASALGCVLFATIFGLATVGDISEMSERMIADGFTVTMWFSLALLALAMVCTLSVKNKIVKKE